MLGESNPEGRPSPTPCQACPMFAGPRMSTDGGPGSPPGPLPPSLAPSLPGHLAREAPGALPCLSAPVVLRLAAPGPSG